MITHSKLWYFPCTGDARKLLHMAYTFFSGGSLWQARKSIHNLDAQAQENTLDAEIITSRRIKFTCWAFSASPRHKHGSSAHSLYTHLFRLELGPPRSNAQHRICLVAQHCARHGHPRKPRRHLHHSYIYLVEKEPLRCVCQNTRSSPSADARTRAKHHAAINNHAFLTNISQNSQQRKQGFHQIEDSCLIASSDYFPATRHL